MEYAACEDRIQKKYLQLQELQANLVVSFFPLERGYESDDLLTD
jgi:hypothetical protein